MKKVIDFLKTLSAEKNFQFYMDNDTKEIWISGYNNSVKFDLTVRPIKNIYIKVVYETPFKRVPILFLDEEQTLKRLQSIFTAPNDNENKKDDDKKEGKGIFGFSGYSIERAKTSPN